LSYNFGSRYARKTINGSLDSIGSLDWKKFWAEKCPVGWRPGQGDVSHKIAKTCPHYDVTHRETQPETKKFIFKIPSKTFPIS